ncbi:MAG: caspase family protein [Acidobacteriota bacterium]
MRLNPLHFTRRPPAWAIALCAGLLSLPAPGPTHAEKRSDPKGPDDLLVVDCLLPQRVRRLGRNSTYLAPRQPIRTTAVDCRIRGGEYTEPDEANYATSLKVWLPQAKTGDAEAQYFVGQIFEKGLGTTPDYGAAAEWYGKAAAQDYGPAQIGLGYLYEEGLGVEQNDVEALNWYRKAAGLAEDLVVLQQQDYDALLEAQAALDASERRATEMEGEIEALRQQLEAAAAETDAEKQARNTLDRLLKRLEADYVEQRRELDADRARVAWHVKQPATAAARPAAAAAAASLSDIAFGNYHALVIGNGSYQQLPSIDTATSEAEKIASTLQERYGFSVRLMLDADRFGIMNALNELREELTSEDHLLVYYVGHGQRDDDGQTAFWQPVDAEPDSPANWIPSAVISEHLDLLASNHVFLVANSVFAGLRTRSSVARLATALTDEERYYHVKQLLEKRSRLVLTSGGEADDDATFADAFIGALEANDGVLEASKLYQNMNADLHAAARDASRLEFATMKWARNDLADFFFVPKAMR